MTELKIIFAFLYDLLLLCAIWVVATIPFVVWQGQGFDEKPLTLLAFQIYLIGITYMYLTHFWVKAGQTPGLKTWRLQLVREDGYLLTRYNANLRFVLSALLFWIGWIGLFTAKKQLLQDIIGKTKIIAVKDKD
ncbi:MAG TPA: RDD family protein [Thiomicrorhabdus sp.]|nr:RDD family protein [Thiomicrorhabdus sp.]